MARHKLAVQVGLCGFVLSCFGGCAITGDVTATDSATAIGATQTINVNTALGADVVKAATDAAISFLTKIPLPVSTDQKKNAVQAGVNAGIDKAKKEGKNVDDKIRSDLGAVVLDAVEKHLKLEPK